MQEATERYVIHRPKRDESSNTVVIKGARRIRAVSSHHHGGLARLGDGVVLDTQLIATQQYMVVIAQTPPNAWSPYVYTSYMLFLWLCPSPCPWGILFEAGLAGDVLDLLELCAHLHDGVSYQARVQAHCAAQRVLCAGARVEAHDEVVADVVGGLQLLRGLGQEEGAPVGDAAHDAVLLEDDLAGRLCDSGGGVSMCWVVGVSERGWLLFHLGEAARAHLLASASSSLSSHRTWATHHSDHLVQHGGGSSVACLDGLKILGFVPELQC